MPELLDYVLFVLLKPLNFQMQFSSMNNVNSFVSHPMVRRLLHTLADVGDMDTIMRFVGNANKEPTVRNSTTDVLVKMSELKQ